MTDSPSDARPNAAARSEPVLERKTILTYCLPVVGVGFLSMPFSIWLMKFSTDVLLVAPAAMGSLLMLARIWDAISDPLAGFLSDRSTARRGRRRAWMFAAAIPMAAATVMLWTPPAFLEGAVLVAWLGFSLILYETASTAFLVPHGALGMELSQDYQERTRLFGYRHVIGGFGAMAGLGAVFLMRTADEPRTMAFAVSVFGGAITAAMILYASVRLPERTEHSGRGARNMRKAFSDVLRNPHGRLLFIVYGIQTFGTASIGLLAPYVMQYIVKAPNLTEVIILLFYLPQLGLAPMWIALGRRFSKKSLWIGAMAFATLAFTTLFLVQENSVFLILFVVTCLGVGLGGGDVIAPSIQADVIDYDDYLTGERKEGAYIAIWNFVRKAAGGVTAGITGFALEASGYVPNADEQTEAVKITILALMGLLPAACYAVGILLFWRFRLNREEHAKVIAAIHERDHGS